jgi:hypothetical protein
MSLTIHQRKALEVAGDETVRAKLQTVDPAPSIVIQFPGAHITRHDVEAWLAERHVVSRPYCLGIRRSLHQWVAVAAKRWRKSD